MTPTRPTSRDTVVRAQGTRPTAGRQRARGCLWRVGRPTEERTASPKVGITAVGRAQLRRAATSGLAARDRATTSSAEVRDAASVTTSWRARASGDRPPGQQNEDQGNSICCVMPLFTTRKDVTVSPCAALTGVPE